MSDFELFSGGDVAESYDPQAFERFKDKIKKNAQFIAALKKQEKKQKDKEDRLIKLISGWIQKNQNRAIMLLVARLIEINVPASFILALILLGNDELQKEAGIVLVSAEEARDIQEGGGGVGAERGALAVLSSDSSVPLRVRAEIEAWSKNMYDAALEFPYRILETTVDAAGAIKPQVTDLAVHVMEDFLKLHSSPMEHDGVVEFCMFLVQGILKKVKSEIEQKQLDTTDEDQDRGDLKK
ncbi:MAG: hypothetical protein AAB592_04120 [Patescibacteria group bacterium]